ncbi:MAG: DMT family transporter [Rhizobiaceae bacterium]|nr:DMT family transporter [Rhizobiaceae bacterium]
MSKNLQGILWALTTTALFSIAAAMAKISVADFHVLQILFIRQLIVFLSVLPSVAKDFPKNLKTNYPLAHMFRLIGAFIALSTGIWAVSVLPLTTATTLAFSQIFFVTLLAMKFLKEPIGLQRISAVIIGFIGVLIVLRPSFNGIADTNSFIPIIGAMGAAVAITCVRKLSQTDTTATLLSYQAIFVGLLSGIPMIWLWVTPNWPDFLFMVAIGIVATAAQWTGIKALREGEANVVSSIGYIQLIYASLLGYLLFSEIPDTFTLIGASLIIASAIYTIRREARQKRAALE